MNVENARYDINEDGVAVVRMDTANSKVIKQFFTSYNIIAVEISLIYYSRNKQNFLFGLIRML